MLSEMGRLLARRTLSRISRSAVGSLIYPRAPLIASGSCVAATGLSAALVTGMSYRAEVQSEGSSGMPLPAAPYLSANFIADAAAKASPTLVNIRVGTGFHQSSGSGFVVDENGLVITNTHVVRDALSRFGGGAVSVTLSNGETLHGVVQHADPISDIAIVKVQAPRPLPAANLGSSAKLRVGEFVVALGAPAGLSNTVTAGIVSSLERTRSDLGLDRRSITGSGQGASRANGMHYIQTDAAINAGNSGGPLLNLAGDVIGVNTMKAQGMDGIAFAVPIDEVKRVVSQLMRHGRVLRPYLGLKFVELDATIANQLEQSAGASTAIKPAKLPTAGLFVMHVAPDSPAQRAGVRAGDTIVGLGGASLRTTRELLDGLADKVGQRVQLELQRSHQRIIAKCDVESMQQ
mmetsp:Transcript_2400/g.6726  ORF Transcript_2400/g.6726 Transcript_2400/m.6726 type:complete len:405 (-) Transcript_2400:393-1607(-)